MKKNINQKKLAGSYAHSQISVFRDSFKMHNAGLAVLLEMAKYFAFAILILISLKIILFSLYHTMPLLLSIQSINDVNPGATTPEMIDEGLIEKILSDRHLITSLLWNVSMTVLMFIIISSMIVPYVNKMILDKTGLKKYTIKAFINLSIITFAYHILFAAAGIAALLLSESIAAILIIWIILALIYNYSMAIYLCTVEGRSIYEDLKNGFIKKMQIHIMIIPVLAGTIVLISALILMVVINMLLGEYTLLLLFPMIALWSVWMKHYVFKALGIIGEPIKN